jgi:hypothetical protein
MKTSIKILWALALPLSSSVASATDIGGFSTPNDAVCAIEAACSLARGGVSDVMTVYAPDGSVFERIFAFGNEEQNNLYYFNDIPTVVQQWGYFAQLVDGTNSYASDAFGVADLTLFSLGYKLGFQSGGEIFHYPITPNIDTFPKILGGNPNHWVLEPGAFSLTIEYDATAYLDLAWQSEGYTATFQSDVSEPTTLALLGIGALATLQRRKRSRNHAPH